MFEARIDAGSHLFSSFLRSCTLDSIPAKFEVNEESVMVLLPLIDICIPCLKDSTPCSKVRNLDVAAADSSPISNASRSLTNIKLGENKGNHVE